jgi:hypothetical protein
MNEDRFERSVRNLVATRDPGPAPERLRIRVAAIPNAAPRPSRFGQVGRFAQLAAAIVLVSAFVGAAVAVRTAGPAIGGPAPAGPAFVTAPDGYFSPESLRDANRRLEAVFATTRLEATLRITAERQPGTIEAPSSVPNRDGDAGRDLLQAFGRGPDGTVTCCISRFGWAVDEALPSWNVGLWTDRLRDGWESPDQSARDETLAAWVRGIEELGQGVALDAGRFADHRLWWFIIAGIGLGVLVIAAIAVLRWGRRLPVASAEPAASVPTAATASATPTAPVSWQESPEAPGGTLDPRIALVGLLGSTLLALAPAVLSVLPLPAGGPNESAIGLELQGRAGPGPDILSGLLLAAGCLGVLAIAARLRRRALALPILLAVVVGLTVLTGSRGLPPPETRYGAFALGEGIVLLDETGGPHRWARTTGAANDRVLLGFDVANPGPVPITIRGLANSGARPSILEWVGLGVRQSSAGVAPVVDDGTRLFEPVRLAPRERLFLVVEGRIGRCGIASQDPQNVLTAPPVELAWDALGWSRTSEVWPSVALLVPTDPACPIPARELAQPEE